MLLEDLLWLILSVVVARGIWRLLDGVGQGLRGPSTPGSAGAARRGGDQASAPPRGVQMARDPVCGTYVVPDRALTIADGSRQVFFCSAACRDKYRAKTA
jgi:YHS domain-containing protein